MTNDEWKDLIRQSDREAAWALYGKKQQEIDRLAARVRELEAALAEGAILTRAEAGVLELKSQHAHTWRDKPEDYWLARLMAEVGELAGALVGDHDDEPEWELTQIAAICINWLELRAALGDTAAGSGSRVRMGELQDTPEAEERAP
jgi:hypothetical protein